MLTEDYLMRMIRLTVAALAQIVGLKAALLHQDALMLIDQSLEGLVGMRADLAKRLDDSGLLGALTFQGKLDLDRVLLVAELFREEAEIQSMMGNSGESRLLYVRALNFYLESVLNEGELSFPGPHEKIRSVLDALGGHDLPTDTLYALFCYHEDAGGFRQAEASLARIASQPGMAADVLGEFKEFYDRLLARPDMELERAGIIRSEIEAALALIELHGPAWLEEFPSRLG